MFALRVLEAAVRHHSYSAAARELGVTQGAVSQQIRKLESELGAKLFLRSGNQMLPSPAANRLAEEIEGALRRLRTGFHEFAENAVQDPLVVSMESRFQGRWLSPRLSRLLAHPAGAQLEIRVEERVANFVNDGVDLAIRVGRGNWPGLRSMRLTTERLCVVCTPEFATNYRIQSATDLLRAPLVHDVDRLWPLLFDRYHLPAPRPDGLVSNSTLLTVDAVLRGLGAALLRYTMIEDDLAVGRLIQPLPDVIPLPLNFIRPGELVGLVKPDDPAPPGLGYFISWRPGNRKQSQIDALCDWLRSEAVESERRLGMS